MQFFSMAQLQELIVLSVKEGFSANVEEAVEVITEKVIAADSELFEHYQQINVRLRDMQREPSQ